MELPDVNPIVDLVSLVLYTGKLESRRPVSALLCAPVDSGKTTWIMDRFLDSPGVHRTNMCTRIGLARWLFAQKRWTRYHHLMIPDLTAPLAGHGESAVAFQGFLMALVYEGITDYHSFHLPQLQLPGPVTIGLVAGIAPSVLKQRKQDWADTGFLRRFLPLSFSYTDKQQETIRMLCLYGRNVQPAPIIIPNISSQTVTVSDDVIAPLALLTDTLLSSNNGVRGTHTQGHTLVEMLRSLVLAHALRRGVTAAESQDVATIIRLSPYINYQMTPTSAMNVDVDTWLPARRDKMPPTPANALEITYLRKYLE